ncbi:SlyX family protein [Azomonas macrocytogenes]|uniref:Protein SlyX homolog n=1 Tax=Azomonas macrocytogenes TaxID=69962 RepID=A0A839SY18_AZOMA|nr:SlyX family protein [Azomonas macrocytogenes]MBB3102247.1 SlyX protein [Azomonas macrocytogenes]
MQQEHEARLVELETRLAFQDDTIQLLSDLLIEQRNLLDRLQARLDRLAASQEELLGRLDLDDDAPPPHY